MTTLATLHAPISLPRFRGILPATALVARRRFRRHRAWAVPAQLVAAAKSHAHLRVLPTLLLALLISIAFTAARVIWEGGLLDLVDFLSNHLFGNQSPRNAVVAGCAVAAFAGAAVLLVAILAVKAWQWRIARRARGGR